MAYAKGRGIAHYQSCAVLQIGVRRVERWAVRLKRSGSMACTTCFGPGLRYAIVPLRFSRTAHRSTRRTAICNTAQL